MNHIRELIKDCVIRPIFNLKNLCFLFVPDCPPDAIGVRIFISGSNGNIQIEQHQHRIISILRSLKIEFVLVDITAPRMEEMKQFMRNKAKKREGQKVAMPPQIFNTETYCGVSIPSLYPYRQVHRCENAGEGEGGKMKICRVFI